MDEQTPPLNPELIPSVTTGGTSPNLLSPNLAKEERIARWFSVINIFCGIVAGLFTGFMTFISLAVGLMSDKASPLFILYFLPLLIPPALVILFITANVKIATRKFRNWTRIIVSFQMLTLATLGTRSYSYLSDLILGRFNGLTILFFTLFLCLTIYSLVAIYWFGVRPSTLRLFINDYNHENKNSALFGKILLGLVIVGHLSIAATSFKESPLESDLRQLLPVIPQTINNCLVISDNRDLGRDERSLCFQKFISLKNDPQICSTLPNSNQGECYFHAAAFVFREINLCNKIDEQSKLLSIPLHTHCLYVTAISTGDSGVCDNLPDEMGYKETCQNSTNLRNQKILLNDQKPFHCGMIADAKEQAGCYMDLGWKTNDLYFCSFIPKEDLNVQETRDNCYSLVGTATKDPVACGEIVSVKEADYCWHLISGPLNNYGFCDRIVDSYRNRSCKKDASYYNIFR